MPTVVVRRHDARRRITTCELPLLPGYVFTSFDAEDDRWLKINQLPHVIKIFCEVDEVGAKPTPLTSTDAGWLLERAAAGPLREAEVAQLIRKGARYLITEGAFQSYAGICKWVRKNSAAIIVNLFGRPTEVSLPTVWLEAV